MDTTYINQRSYIAQNWWERRSFTHRWWRLYQGDPYWVPPYYPTLRRALEPERNSHLARMQPALVYAEALPRYKNRALPGNGYAQEPLFEQPVAAVVALGDPRRRDRTAYLALLRCINDTGSLERLLESLAEILAPKAIAGLSAPPACLRTWAAACFKIIGTISPRSIPLTTRPTCPKQLILC